MKFQKAFLIKPGQFEVRDVTETIKPHEVMLQILTCGLCNWELNFWKGTLNWGYPQELGHEYAGVITEVGSEVRSLKVGDYVTALHGLGGFAEYKAVPEDRCFKLASGVNPKFALGEPLKCIVTVLRGTSPVVGDNGLVHGTGPMGLWAIQALAGKTLNTLIAVDLDDKRLELATKYGATHTINASREDVQARVAEITAGRFADWVIEGTGDPELVGKAQTFLKSTGRGRLVLMSSHEEAASSFDFREAIQRSLEIIVPHPAYSNDQLDDMRRAVNHLNSGVFQMTDLIRNEFELKDIQNAFEALEHKPAGYLKGIVVPAVKGAME